MMMYIDSCAPVQPSTAVPSFNSMGLLLLSKRPLQNSIAVDMYPNIPQLLRRGYLQSFVSYLGQAMLLNGRNLTMVVSIVGYVKYYY